MLFRSISRGEIGQAGIDVAIERPEADQAGIDVAVSRGEADQAGIDVAIGRTEADQAGIDVAISRGEAAQAGIDVAVSRGEAAQVGGDVTISRGEIGQAGIDVAVSRGEAAQVGGDVAIGRGETDQAGIDVAISRTSAGHAVCYVEIVRRSWPPATPERKMVVNHEPRIMTVAPLARRRIVNKNQIMPAKDPDDVLDYTIDWGRFLPDGATITSCIWFTEDLVDRSHFINGQETTIYLDGGDKGQQYQITAEIEADIGGPIPIRKQISFYVPVLDN